MPNFKGRLKILTGVICLAVVLALALGLWLAISTVNRVGGRVASEDKQQRDVEEQQNSKKTETSNNAERTNAEQEPSVPVEVPETAPKIPTTSKPEGLIIVDLPQNGEVIIGSRFVLSGKANVAENTLFYKVEDAQGKQWIAGATQVSGKWGSFSIIIDPTNLSDLTIKGSGPRQLTVKIHNDLGQQSEQVVLMVIVVP